MLGRPDGFERWAPVLVRMPEQKFSKGRMIRETKLSYNTVKAAPQEAGFNGCQDGDMRSLGLTVATNPTTTPAC